ncbi:MAG: putative membrane protein YpjA, partial [Natrialbaceae archaeon]
MSVVDRFEDFATGRGLPDRPDLPWYVQPVPRAIENVGLRLAWVVVAINLVGTAFGFWYYGFHPLPLSDPLIVDQFAMEPVAMWPLVPDSPAATLFIALAIA